MNVDDITTVVRPRSAWEAIDLGIVMARNWWWPLARVWLVVSLPILLVLELTLYTRPWLVLLLIWWLKPLWERPLLYILSQAFFGRLPSLRETLRAFPAMAGNQWFASLTWRRFSPSRSMDLPVIQLERLKGRQRARRLAVLHRTVGGGAGWLTIVGVHIESLLALAAVALAVMFTPVGSGWDSFGLFMGESLLAGHLSVWLTYLCMWLVAPFYVAAGFSLYLNRRIWLEGWDIELGFRRMQQRLVARRRAGGVAAAICCCLVMAAAGDEVWAGDDELSRASAKAMITQIVADDDFNQTRTVHRLTGWAQGPEADATDDAWEPPAWLSDLVAFNAETARLLLWVAVAIGIIILAVRYRHWLSYYTPASQASEPGAVMPETMFGLAVGRHTLPDDVVAQVRGLWGQRRYRAAFALLYRASLTILMERHQCPFNEALTEGECMRVVEAAASRELSDYFAELTGHWQSLAYGHQMPDGEVFEALCQRWPRMFDDDGAVVG